MHTESSRYLVKRNIDTRPLYQHVYILLVVFAPTCLQVRSGSGNITVAGVDGPASLSSSGSETNLQVRCSKHVQSARETVLAESQVGITQMPLQVLRNTDFQAINEGGVIRVQLEPGKVYQVHARASGGVSLGDGCKYEQIIQESNDELHGWISCEPEASGGSFLSDMTSDSLMSHPEMLRFSANQIFIQRKSWRSSLQEKLMKKLVKTSA